MINIIKDIFSPIFDKNNNRVYWVDVAKFICIELVMLSHWEYCPGRLYWFISPVFLVTFFFCAGYCYNHKLGFKDFLVRKIKTLFIPWLFYSYLNILLSSIISFKEHEPVLSELLKNALQIRGYGDKLWFIACMFTAYIVFYFIIQYHEKTKNKSNYIIAFLALVYFLRDLYFDFFPSNFFPWNSNYLPWHIDYIPIACFYMYLGYIYKKNYECKQRSNNLVFLTVPLYFIFTYYSYRYAYTFPVVIDLIITFVRHLIGIVFIVYVSKKVKYHYLISYIGANTLLYFSLHNKIQTFLEVLISKIVPSLVTLFRYNEIVTSLFGILFVAVASLLLLIPTCIIRKYLGWTIGK